MQYQIPFYHSVYPIERNKYKKLTNFRLCDMCVFMKTRRSAPIKKKPLIFNVSANKTAHE